MTDNVSIGFCWLFCHNLWTYYILSFFQCIVNKNMFLDIHVTVKDAYNEKKCGFKIKKVFNK